MGISKSSGRSILDHFMSLLDFVIIIYTINDIFFDNKIQVWTFFVSYISIFKVSFYLSRNHPKTVRYSLKNLGPN